MVTVSVSVICEMFYLLLDVIVPVEPVHCCLLCGCCSARFGVVTMIKAGDKRVVLDRSVNNLKCYMADAVVPMSDIPRFGGNPINTSSFMCFHHLLQACFTSREVR